MQSRTKHKTPIITLIIIAINVLVFFFSVIGSPVAGGSTDTCLRERHPQCLVLAEDDEIRECALATAERGKNPQQCLYKISDDCKSEFSQIEECFSPIVRTAYQYGTIPANTGAVEQFFRMISSMFVHGGWGHLVGNMVILFLTGIYLEVRMGRIKYFILYMLSGIGADLLHILMHPDALGPAVGASGAVFGIFGATLAMKYHYQYKAIIPRIKNAIFYEALPTGYFWYVLLITIVSLAFVPDTGISYAAHLGGFIAGYILIFFLMKNNKD